jgi:predicted transcriptional regulator
MKTPDPHKRIIHVRCDREVLKKAAHIAVDRGWTQAALYEQALAEFVERHDLDRAGK